VGVKRGQEITLKFLDWYDSIRVEVVSDRDKVKVEKFRKKEDRQ